MIFGSQKLISYYSICSLWVYLPLAIEFWSADDVLGSDDGDVGVAGMF